MKYFNVLLYPYLEGGGFPGLNVTTRGAIKFFLFFLVDGFLSKKSSLFTVRALLYWSLVSFKGYSSGQNFSLRSLKYSQFHSILEFTSFSLLHSLNFKHIFQVCSHPYYKVRPATWAFFRLLPRTLATGIFI